MSMNNVCRSTRLFISGILNNAEPYINRSVFSYHTSCLCAAEKRVTDSEEKPKYFQGKKIVEEKVDPYTLEHVLLSITGYDPAVLDSYSKCVQTGAQMTDVNVTKSFSLAATTESFNVRKSESQLRKDQMHYKLKKHQRIIQVADLKADKMDIFIDYINEKLPSGVQIKLELKRWEELVAPNHPSLHVSDRTASRYQKS